MVKLKIFIALLPLLGLLPTFQGTEFIEPTVTVNFYKKVAGESNVNGNAVNQQLENGLFLNKRNIGPTIKKKFHTMVKGGFIINGVIAYIKNKNTTDLEVERTNYTFWVRNKVSSTTSATNNTYTALNKDTEINEDTIIDALVSGEDEKIVRLIAKKTAPTTSSTTPPPPTNAPPPISPTNAPPPISPTNTRPPISPTNTPPPISPINNNIVENDKPWSWGTIIGFTVTGVVVVLAIGSFVYSLFGKNKEVSSALTEEEEEEEEEL